MIRRCTDADFDTILAIINDAAQAYCGVIPTDCFQVPYMPEEYLRHELESGVRFFGWDEGGELVGIMASKTPIVRRTTWAFRMFRT